MFATAPLPYYSAYRSQRRKVSNNMSKDASSPSSPKSLPPPPAPPSAPPTQHNSNAITDLLEPAIDGPPSPERIRALSKQMQRASVLDKHRSSNTTSSGSSSLRSLASDRPSWEQSLENVTLSRRSSGRSTSSSMPSREQRESVQLFGKTIFNRRGKMKRESSAHSSSGSSLYSADLTDGPPSSTRDIFMPAIFNRRRTMKPGSIEEEHVSPKKFQISGPYNFQHVTHTHREHLPNMQRTSRVELVSEFSAHRAAQVPTAGSLKGIEADDLHFSNFSSEAVNLYDDPSHDQHRPSHFFVHRPAPPIPRQPAPTSAPRRLMKHSRSQEQLRTSPPRPAPPRPPRSPVEQSFAPPIPPPRISSRLSMRYDGFDPLATTTLERPQTSGGFRHPKPFSPPATSEEPPATSHGYTPRTADFTTLSEAAFSHAITTPDDAAWPLTASTATFAYETVLPDVPEEEESYVLSRRSRASLVSNNSSLRGSQSVPLLRQMAQSHSSVPPAQRPASGASDTLGRLDMFAAQRAMRSAMQDGAEDDSLARETWEDDIDYCYEHEADADFEYAWDRPSLDLTREEDSHTPVDQIDFGLPSAGLRPAPQRHSPGLLPTSSHFDMPALSPAASQASTTAGHEALTPTVASMPVKSNFSHPRLETTYRGQNHLHVRTPSHTSSFKESDGFHLSPSLLIPEDYRQQMGMNDSEMDEFHEDFITHNGSHFPYDDEPTMTVGATGFFVQDRASTSTTGTNSSDQTSSSGERHVSTNSTWTTLTRFTGNTSYDGWNPKVDFAERLPPTTSDEQVEPESPKLTRMVMSPLPESEEMISQSSPDISASSAGLPSSPTRRNDPKLARESLQISKSKENMSLKHRRQRARTTSLSTPPPPPGQYALFPPVYTDNRI